MKVEMWCSVGKAGISVSVLGIRLRVAVEFYGLCKPAEETGEPVLFDATAHVSLRHVAATVNVAGLAGIVTIEREG